jgi:hypothetical protein
MTEKITKIDRQTGRKLLAGAVKHLESYADQYGLSVDHNSFSYDDGMMTMRIRFGVVHDKSGGEKMLPEEIEFRNYAKHFGFEPNDYGAMFITNGKIFQVAALKIGGHKYQVIGKTVPGGKRFKFTKESVKFGIEEYRRKYADPVKPSAFDLGGGKLDKHEGW